MDKMAVPQPTSRTTLSLKMCLFCMMAFMYERVRTSSFCSAQRIRQSQFEGIAGSHVCGGGRA